MTIKYNSLYNCAAAGAAAGMSSQKQALYENGNDLTPVQPADAATLLTTSFAFAVEVDATLQTMTPSSGAVNVTGLVAAGAPPSATVSPSTAALADASAYLPVVMGLMAKGAMDGRGIPYNQASPPVPYAAADWENSGIPTALTAYFLAFAEGAFADAAGTVKYVPLANAAMGAAMAGMLQNRQELFGLTGLPLTPSNFSVHVATAKAFATQVDASLQAALSPPTNLTGMVTGGPDYTTVVPSTAALSNALYSLTAAMGSIAKAIFDNRGIPKDAAGVAFVQADYIDIASTVAAQFIQYANNVQTA
jgi:hypothetical protein